MLNALLRHNYLPTQRKSREEIPPIFSTDSFTEAAARDLTSLKYRRSDGGGGYDQVEYRMTRFNHVSRLLSIPHPLPHAKLCLALHDHWDKLEYIVSNPNSQIKPQTFSDGRVVIMNGYGDSTQKANQLLKAAFGKRYRVSTDIASCFPSIYSHAVPWALVTHEVAKSKRFTRDEGEWFNQIDKHLRACRKDETQGIAIGPGTSSIIAEIVLGRIDEALRDRFLFTRYIDDYICHCEFERDAEHFVRELEKEAAKFKLQLNIKKTKIARLPQPVTDSWVLELGRHLPPEGEVLTSFHAFRFLDFAVSLAERFPEGSVLKYAASVVASRRMDFCGDAEILNYLISLAFHNPVILPVLGKLIDGSYLAFAGAEFDLYGTSEKLQKISRECARLGRSDGVCWSLYYLGHVSSAIAADTAESVIQSEDALSILTLYWASEEHHEAVVDFCDDLDKTDLYLLDRYWILLYQLFLDGKIADPYEDGVFNLLSRHGVNFVLPKTPIIVDT